MKSNLAMTAPALRSAKSMIEERPIDLVHLARQTLGDPSLESEILSLFVRQSQALGARISEEQDVKQRSNLAHTLLGSARAVGAWQVARMAECVEMMRDAGDTRRALAELDASIRDAVAAIEALSDGH